MNETEKVLLERKEDYGDYASQCSISSGLKKILRENGRSMTLVTREAMDMTCVKLSRLANGNCEHRDSWVDIAGYATLVVKILDEEEE